MPPLNWSQKNALRVVLYRLNKTLRDMEEALARPDGEDVLFAWKNRLPREEQERARALAKDLRAELGRLAGVHGIAPELEDPMREILGRLHIEWVGLQDSRAAAMKRYGAVDPDAGVALDPALESLADLVDALIVTIAPKEQ